MKAVFYDRYGNGDVLRYGEIERPAPGPGQVLLQVAATSFNPVDAGIRGGYLTDAFDVTFPHVPGIDVAGTVAELGEGVRGWQVGDAVIGLLPLNANGAAAEFVLAAAEELAAAPRSAPLADAAALPTAGLTALQALSDVAGAQPGQKLLINGATGAVGGYAVQLGKQADLVVTATAKPADVERVRNLGADHVIAYVDYSVAPIDLAGQPFDVILNLVSTSEEQTAALVDAVADGGFLVGTMTAGPEDAPRGVRTQRMFVRSDPAQLASLVERVDTGRLRIEISDRRPLAEAAAVHAESDAGRLRGKTILYARGR